MGKGIDVSNGCRMTEEEVAAYQERIKRLSRNLRVQKALRAQALGCRPVSLFLAGAATGRTFLDKGAH
jgi:hypothetical protein